jgi:transcriptional regulator with XRE-family HTH domain
MTHGTRLRERIQGLIRLGVTQKTIAARMGLSESTFSRWFRAEPDSKGRAVKIPLDALDAFDRYIDEIASFASSQETPRAVPTTSAEPPFPGRPITPDPDRPSAAPGSGERHRTGNRRTS